MTGKKEKTISGAMYSEPNLEHNLRTHIPPNSVEGRHHLNGYIPRIQRLLCNRYMRSYLLSRIKSGGTGRLRKGAVKDFH